MAATVKTRPAAPARTTLVEAGTPTFDKRLRDSRDGVETVAGFFRGGRFVREVLDLQSDPKFFSQGDLAVVWETESGESFRTLVEVKVDDWSERTGNFFFETLSSVEAGTPGCFLATEADYMAYFVRPGRIFIIEMAPARAWFLANMERFRKRQTKTPFRPGCNRGYTTEGRLVNIELFCREMAGLGRGIARCYRRQADGKFLPELVIS